MRIRPPELFWRVSPMLLSGLIFLHCSGGDEPTPAGDDDLSPTAVASPTATASSCTCAYLRQAVFPTYCGSGETGSCHMGSNPDGGLDLVDATCASALINVTPTNAAAAADGLKRVEPGSLEHSYLWLKVGSGLDGLPANYGGTMPPNIRALPDEPLQAIQCWIESGAPAD